MPTERVHTNLTRRPRGLQGGPRGGAPGSSRRHQEAPEGARRHTEGPREASGRPFGVAEGQNYRKEEFDTSTKPNTSDEATPGKPQGDPRSRRGPESSIGVHDLGPRVNRLDQTRQLSESLVEASGKPQGGPRTPEQSPRARIFNSGARFRASSESVRSGETAKESSRKP